ncbi:hypothetical protein LP420_39760 [Massilia sp. B-10]|nr:hypothetical protein LP420_39760 [Massilia sp. B-10]
MAQDGNFAVSNRYFSPNGDGIKDSTTLGVRLAQAADITVSVVGRSGKRRACSAGAHFKNVTGATVVWDGLNQRGTVVDDGDYTLRVTDTKGKLLGQSVVTVDTNRSSLLRAVDTEFGQFSNMSCRMDKLFRIVRRTAPDHHGGRRAHLPAQLLAGQSSRRHLHHDGRRQRAAFDPGGGRHERGPGSPGLSLLPMAV